MSSVDEEACDDACVGSKVEFCWGVKDCWKLRHVDMATQKATPLPRTTPIARPINTVTMDKRVVLEVVTMLPHTG